MTSSQGQQRQQTARRPQLRQRGGITIYLVVVLVAFGVLAIAGASRFGSSIISVFSPNCSTAARMMAESGMRYAMARLRAANTQVELDAARTDMHNKTFLVDQAKGLGFTLSIGYDGSGNLQVNATGQACSASMAVDTPQASLSVNVPKVGAQPPGNNEVTIEDDPFVVTTDLQQGGSSPISVDPATGTITFGILGQTGNAAAIWYSGNATGGCLEGNCTMTYGLRAAFDVLWTAGSAADGLVFGIISGETNTVSSVGGSEYQGELMGWGGPGTSGRGIQPPKIGLEFDTYYNACDSRIYVPGSRCDATTRDHMAYVFWGSNTALNLTYTYNATGQNVPIIGPSYDDNRHGAGSGAASEPIAWGDPDGLGSGRFGYYYSTYNEWLKGRTTTPVIAPVKYAIRYELGRIGTKNAEGNHPYVLKTWIRTGTGISPYNDTTTNYTAAPPDMQRVVHLTPALHAQMAKVLFGWSEATGASTQELKVSNFSLNFKSAPDTLAIPMDYVSYWNMNAGSGATVADSNATNHNDGTIIGTPNWVTPASYAYGKALGFAGDASRVSVPDANSLDLTTRGSIAAWIYPTALTNDTYILHKGHNSTSDGEAYGLRLSTGGRLELSIRYGSSTNSYIILESTALPAANRWYHVVAQWDNSILAVYINGMLNSIATNPNQRAAQATAGNLIIGARHTVGASNYRGFNGYIDEVYLYNRVLTAEEIAAMSLMPLP